MRWTSFAAGTCVFSVVQLVQSHYVEETVFPSPNATGTGWEDAFVKASALTAQLNLTEKIFMVTGVKGPCVGNIPAIPRVGFKGLCLQDGPLAIRQASYASVFPAGLSAAATWDRELIYQRGVALGEEFRGKGANVILGPVAGPLGRSVEGGRNWEGFSPDPYLTGIAFAKTIEGIQSQNVQACGKHYIGYEQETQRNPTVNEDGVIIEAVSSNIDDRTMHELYLWPFADGIKSGLASIMCSYNRLNETYACQNSKTQNGLLKSELGFQGYVMSDWGGTHSGVDAILSGEDMNMPGNLGPGDSTVSSYWGYNITTFLNNGSVPESRIDDMVRRILTLYFYFHQDDDSWPTIDLDTVLLNEGVLRNDVPEYQHPFNFGNVSDMNRDVRADHGVLIRQIGSASTVLLKNVNNTLPLRSPKRIAVFGNAAPDLSGGPYDPENENGPQAVGGGSGTGRFTYLIPPLKAIKQRNPSALVEYVTDNTLLTTQQSSTILTIYPQPDVCLVFLKSFATEGADRASLLCDFNSTGVVNTVTSSGLCPNTIVITNSPGPNVLPWADNKNVTGVIVGHYPGEQVGNSIVDVLFGDVNPSGKLPYTIAYQASDYNAPIVNFTGVDDNDPNLWQSNFTEGLLIDYRHFDYNNITPRYEFGFGLSYTTFSLSNLQISSNASKVSAYPPSLGSQIPPPGGNPALYDILATVAVDVKNTGSVAGATVPQLYLGFPPDTPGPTPPKVLRGFDKTSVLAAGQQETIWFSLRRKDVSFWDVVRQEWAIPSGPFTVLVGQSSRDLLLSGELTFL
uniref:Probable beta-glucosidase G n=1 Tax=Rasamsonia emersonii TaxID=68825 RepID=Q8J261_RASEM|nr:avenacinase [Rasamsonia emersonii]